MRIHPHYGGTFDCISDSRTGQNEILNRVRTARIDVEADEGALAKVEDGQSRQIAETRRRL